MTKKQQQCPYCHHETGKKHYTLLEWQNIANIIGGLEICDSETGWPIGVLKPVGIEYYEDIDD